MRAALDMECCADPESRATQYPLVSVVVVTYNGDEAVENCLKSLQQTAYPNFKVLVVDNGSSNGVLERLRRRFPSADYLRLTENKGFAGAANEGIRKSLAIGASLVVVCNDDIEFVDKRWLSEAMRLMQADPQIGAVGFTEASEVALIELPESPSSVEVENLVGFSVVYRAAVFERIGLMDEDYLLYSEEDDIIKRLLDASYYVIRLSIPVYHIGGSTIARCSMRASYLQMRNGLRYSIKNRSVKETLNRLVKYFDIACNPWPIWYSSIDNSHRRCRLSGNCLFNFILLVKAVASNCIELPKTLGARTRDREKVAAARAALRRELEFLAMEEEDEFILLDSDETASVRLRRKFDVSAGLAPRSEPVESANDRPD